VQLTKVINLIVSSVMAWLNLTCL